MKAITVTTSGEISITDIPDNSRYEKIKDFIGGWLDAVNIGNLGYMYINEDGKSLNLPINHMATAIYNAFTGISDVIVGNAILFGMPDDEGNETSVSEELISLFAKHLPITE